MQDVREVEFRPWEKFPITDSRCIRCRASGIILRCPHPGVVPVTPTLLLPRYRRGNFRNAPTTQMTIPPPPISLSRRRRHRRGHVGALPSSSRNTRRNPASRRSLDDDRLDANDVVVIVVVVDVDKGLGGRNSDRRRWGRASRWRLTRTCAPVTGIGEAGRWRRARFNSAVTASAAAVIIGDLSLGRPRD
jgi:hypothetical protein